MKPIDRRTVLTAAAALPAALSAQAQERLGFGYRGPGRQTGTGGADRPLAGLRTRFACNIEMWGFGTDDPAERVRKAAGLGFTGVEFWPWRGKDLDALAKACKDTGVAATQFTAWGFTPGLNETKNHDAFIKEIAASIETARRLDVKYLTVVAGNDVKGLTQEQMHQNVIAGLKLAAPLAEKAGVTLMLEPMNVRVDHPGHCLYGSAPALRIVRAVDSPSVKILWDLYHMHITEGDLCGHLREGIQEVAYVQVADHPGRTEPGTGEIHYNRVFRELHDLGFTGWVGLECGASEGERKAAERVRAADQW
jgi:hydroxypyruvate isomerase